MAKIDQAFVKRVQLVAMLGAGLLSAFSLGRVFTELSMPRVANLGLAVLLLVDGATLFWTFHRLKA